MSEEAEEYWLPVYPVMLTAFEMGWLQAAITHYPAYEIAVNRKTEDGGKETVPISKAITDKIYEALNGRTETG